MLVGEVVRHRLAGLAVHRVARQHAGLERPVLVELRRQLDEVARDVRARQAGVRRVGEDAVQRVAELVEQRLAPRRSVRQRRLAGGGLHDVGDVADDRLRAQQLRLDAEVVHPRAAVLVVAREVVGVEQRQRRPVVVEDLEDADVGVVDREVVPLGEGDAVQLVRREEDAVLAARGRARGTGASVSLSRSYLRLPHLLGVEGPSPTAPA